MGVTCICQTLIYPCTASGVGYKSCLLWVTRIVNQTDGWTHMLESMQNYLPKSITKHEHTRSPFGYYVHSRKRDMSFQDHFDSGFEFVHPSKFNIHTNGVDYKKSEQNPNLSPRWNRYEVIFFPLQQEDEKFQKFWVKFAKAPVDR